MTRLEHVTLPAGLSAIAREDDDGELTITVSDTLEPDQRRAAVRVALRATRRHDWRLGLLPVPAFAFLPAIRAGVRNLGRLLRVHAAATTVVTSSVVLGVAGAAVMIATVPHAHNGASQAGPSYRPSPAVGQPIGPRTGSTSRSGATPSHGGSTGPGVVAVATHRSGPGQGPRPVPSASASTQPATGTSAPEPSSSASPPAGNPSPTPTPAPSSPSSGGGGTCVRVLGIVICV
jgi:hypothetical protein